MKQFYRAPMGRSVKLITWFASVLLAGFPLIAIISGFRSGSQSALFLLPIVVWGITLAFMISGYELTRTELRIYRLGWKSVFSLASLEHAEVNADAMARSLRLFGNGGLFSICGLFKNRVLGRYRAFVTDPKKSVVLRFSDTTIVVSPDRPEEFVNALKPPTGGIT